MLDRTLHRFRLALPAAALLLLMLAGNTADARSRVSFLSTVGSTAGARTTRDYQVRPGDAWERIARRARTTVAQLQALNPEVTQLEPSMVIQLPAKRRRRRWRRRFQHMGEGPGYRLRQPKRAWGTLLTVSHLRDVFGAYQRQFPAARPVWVHDLSSRRGGRLPPHVSHRTGRDVDVRVVLRWETDRYLEARPRTLHLERTWFLVNALVGTGDVQFIFFDYRLQRALYRHAKRQGVPTEELQRIFQYPYGRNSNHGIVRHEPGHRDHLHIRFVADTNPANI